jgi:hypothetical protein
MNPCHSVSHHWHGRRHHRRILENSPLYSAVDFAQISFATRIRAF